MKRLSIFICLAIGILVIVAGCGKSGEKAPEANLNDPGANHAGSSSWEAIEGVWEGAINVPNQPLPIHITFKESEGTISIPVQGITNYPLSNVNLSGSDLSFEMEIQGQSLKFVGQAEQEKISGTFTQSGQSFPFELNKGSEEQMEDPGNTVQVELKDGMMAGQLELPQGEGPFPLMVIIAGSGPTDRDGNSPLIPGKNNSLKMLAEQLAAEGVASIRYDKRGIGANTGLGGKEEDLRFDDFIDDAAAWVQFAQKDERFSKVGIIGHSEGSLIGMAAAEKTGADAYISIAGAGRPIDQVLLEQLENQLPDQLLKESIEILEQLKQGKQVETVSDDLQMLFRPSVQPYMISWLQYHPTELLQKLKSSVLIINGTSDLQVPVTDAELLHGAKKDSELLIIDRMNHVFKESSQDQEENMATYSNPDLPLAKGLLEGLIGFMKNADLLQ